MVFYSIDHAIVEIREKVILFRWLEIIRPGSVSDLKFGRISAIIC
jgi:hypothetical protein